MNEHDKCETAMGEPVRDAGRRSWRQGRTPILVGLTALADDVQEHWRASDYPPDMQRHREQFRHAHTHAVKALGRIAALIDHADRDSLTCDEARGLVAELPKLLADLVRTAAKMAETAPAPVCLALAYADRAELLAARWPARR